MAERIFPDVDLNCETNKNYHLGHILLESFKKKHPDDIAQINGITGEKTTYHSMHHSVVRLARSLLNYGMKPGDVMALSGVSHLDLRIPFFAGMVNGHPVAGIDPCFKFAEIKHMLSICKPKIAFCEKYNENNFTRAAEVLKLDMKIVTFLEGENVLQKFIEKYDDDKPAVADYIPPPFDLKEAYFWLTSTSGSDGMPKLVGTKHNTLQSHLKNFTLRNRGSTKVVYLLSSIQWITYYTLGIEALFNNNIILLTPDKRTEIVINTINKYRKRIRSDARVIQVYGCTEMLGTVSIATDDDAPIGSCGKVTQNLKAKVVDEDGNEIMEPNVPGELYVKGLMFDGYYNNPKDTAKAITADGWLKTGDRFYIDENGFLFFVERIKMMIKFRGHQIVPQEIEEVIREHKGVKDVAVTSITHPVDLAWPVAVVARRTGADVTAQEIKDLVAARLSDPKHLRGGVVFVEELPLTSTDKLSRMEVKRIAETSARE